jgi:hypothetical protein
MMNKSNSRVGSRTGMALQNAHSAKDSCDPLDEFGGHHAQLCAELGIVSPDPPGDFLDTAAVMSQLDLVVTPETAVAHVAGSLGVEVWVALSQVSDWRWELSRDESAWYPTMR